MLIELEITKNDYTLFSLEFTWLELWIKHIGMCTCEKDLS
jgi:hypothetical protein